MRIQAARRAAVLTGVLAVAIGWAAGETALAAEKMLLDFDKDFDFAKVQASDAKVSAAKRDAGAALAVATGHAQDWPGVTLKAPGGSWDLSAYEFLALDVRNTGSSAVTVHCRVDNEGADGAKNCNTESIALKPGEAGTLKVTFKRAPPALEGVKLFGMRGYPVGQGGQGTIDPSKVIGLVIFVARPGEDHTFEVDSIRAGGTFAAPREPALTAGTFFPFIDTFGQYVHREWPGKTHSLEELAKAREAEEADMAARPGPANWDPYGGWKDGPQLKATGFFYPAKHEGKWWLVDPEGRLFFSHGIDCVCAGQDTPIDDREAWFQDFPGARPEFKEFLGKTGFVIHGDYKGRQPRTFNFAGANLKRKYGDAWRERAAGAAHRRLRSWGMNTVGNWSDAATYMAKKTPYVVAIGFDRPLIAGSEGYWGKFPDPFHPDFERNLKARMAHEAGKTAADPMCIGYFVDNEIAWGDDTSLALASIQSPADQPAKQAFLADLKAKYGEIATLNAAWGAAHASWDALAAATAAPDKNRAGEDLRAFYTRVAEQYFKVCRDAVKAAAPNHLYMGPRFAWVNDRAVAAGAKYCDVVSYNLYQRSVADFRMPGGLDAPVIIGEFHLGALDRGMFHTGLVPVGSQEARAAAYKAYVTGAIRNPQIVGTHWFQYQDQAATGRSFDGENYQIGFVDVCDRPYPETIAACREVGYGMYEARLKGK